ncbi:MAG TPA: bifunctional adenosylcobinamide kinase/adenosylcobinamide-phosphate guanylyltransferase [Acidimicrobiales bacterium]|nr:bifunctional adenosylcobinamide kinase/adenosylcobinamide-phosphate guanylyltransferase [Acidimicrobiales bacterium]
MALTLVLGGARSGKSALAERMVKRMPMPTTYIAPAVVDPDDADFLARIELHRARRPGAWRTIECGTDIGGALTSSVGTALVDSLGTWVAAYGGEDPDVPALLAALAARTGDTVLVSDEVGFGVHPATEVGRRFREQLGDVNVAVAAVADQVLLVVAGRVLSLEASPW